MIRWRYLVPRILIVLVVMLLLGQMLPPLVRSATVKVGQAVFRARVDVGGVDVGLFPPRLGYRDVQIGNASRNRQMRNLVSADRIAMTIDGSALLRRRYLIREAKVSGLQFDSQRLTSGHLQRAAAPKSSEPSQAALWMSRLLNSAGGAVQQQAAELVAQSESRRRGDEIRHRWQVEYDALAARASELETSIKRVHETAKGIENPLRDWSRVDATLTEAREIQRELAAVRKRLDELPLQIQADMLSLEQAKQADLQRVRELLPVDLDGGRSLGPGLLAEAIRNQIERVRGYLDAGRNVSRMTVAAPKAERRRGRVINLQRGRPQPTLLVGRCEIAGVLTSGGRPYQLAGVIENLCTQPQLRPHPLRARLRLDGDQTARIDYVRDDSADQPREMVTLHWPDAKAPTLRLGVPGRIDLDVRDGRREWWVQLHRVGERIDGRFVARRIETRIELQSHDPAANSPMLAILQQRLASVDRIEIDATLAGTWDAPQLALSTNLSGVLNAALRDAATAQVAEVRAELRDQIDQLHAEQLARLQRWSADQQGGASELLAKADATVQQISQKVLSETSKADAYFGRLRGKLSAPTVR